MRVKTSNLGGEGLKFGMEKSAESVTAVVGNTEGIGVVLYSTYLLPFEVASLILLVAMIGAVILTKKGIMESKS